MFISEMLIYGVISKTNIDSHILALDDYIYRNNKQTVYISVYNKSLVKDVKIDYSTKKLFLKRSYYEISK